MCSKNGSPLQQCLTRCSPGGPQGNDENCCGSGLTEDVQCFLWVISLFPTPAAAATAEAAPSATRPASQSLRCLRIVSPDLAPCTVVHGRLADIEEREEQRRHLRRTAERAVRLVQD